MIDQHVRNSLQFAAAVHGSRRIVRCVSQFHQQLSPFLVSVSLTQSTDQIAQNQGFRFAISPASVVVSLPLTALSA